jgi:fructose-bisphosphate aldolase, class I
VSEEHRETLESTAKEMVARGKGLLAADESNSTAGKRLDKIGVESTEDTRRQYRELFFTTEGVSDYISGVILYDETIRQSSSDGTPFPDLLRSQGIIPGIKVDTGAKPLALAPGEKVTEGLDGLRERLEEYRDEYGARFGKWRAVITIGEGIPSRYCIEANAHALGRYAALCQEQGIVPVVEPEVIMDGEHTIDQSYDVTLDTLKTVFDQLFLQRVMLEGMLLKCNMVMSGYEAEQQASVDEVAERTLDCLKKVVPPAVPGIVFLSGGQDDLKATQHLQRMNEIRGVPWELSFSYARALQGAPLEIWGGDESKIPAAQSEYQHLARRNSAAREGSYSEEMEKEKEAVA